MLYPKVQSRSLAQNEDASPLCISNAEVKPSNGVSNKPHYRSMDSISSTTPTRPKLRAIHSSDTSRFPTLERLENTMLFSKNSKIIVEPVTFTGEFNSNNMTKGSQSDVKSIHSFTGSIKSNHKKKQAKMKKNHQSTPTEIFAKNLNDAVLDADDSVDSGYVYNTKSSCSLYPPSSSPPFLYDSSVFSTDNSSSYFSNHHQKFRRPALRSTVSELPSRGAIPFYLESMTHRFEKQRQYHSSNYFRYSSGDEEDIERAPLLCYTPPGRKHNNSRRKKVNKSSLSIFSKLVWHWWFCIVTFLTTLICLILTLLARPLKLTEITSLGNVLATQKQLIFDLYVRASNSNGWNIQISHGAVSLFASSHFVPTIMNTTSNRPEITRKRQEYLGNINKLDDPLIFDASPVFYFKSKSTTSTGQLQINNPGATEGDKTGNERWSLLIRYPYELTIRGVLRYQLFPYLNSKVYSARVCKIVQVDPATGKIEDVPSSEQTICEEPQSI